jgi:co-chaperonin GroES (HSP10)
MSKLEAISGNVFVARDEKESEFDGIHVSQGALTGNMWGTIVAIGDCPYAKVGDRVHIPHYTVVDIEYDGKTYAMFKQSELFYVNGEVVNGYALIRKAENDHVRDESGEIALYMTDHHIEFTHWVEVLEVAKDCENLKPEHEGLFCVAPENSMKLARIGNSKDFAMHESLIEFLTTGE